MTDQSMRGFLAALDAAGELHRVTRKVDPKFELGAVLALKDRGPALLFENVAGSTMPVAGNLLVSRDRFARAFGVTREALDAHCLKALAQPIKPAIVNDAPVQAVIHDKAIDIGKLLPVPHWFEREAAPYITAGVIIAKDPETGKRNVSIARLRLEGGNRLMAGIAKNHHLYVLAEKAKALGPKAGDRSRDRQSSGGSARLAALSRPWRRRIREYRRAARGAAAAGPLPDRRSRSAGRSGDRARGRT